MKLLLCLLGMVLVLEGIPYFAFPGKMKKWMMALLEVPNTILRVMAFLAIILGLLLVYFFRP